MVSSVYQLLYPTSQNMGKCQQPFPLFCVHRDQVQGSSGGCVGAFTRPPPFDELLAQTSSSITPFPLIWHRQILAGTTPATFPGGLELQKSLTLQLSKQTPHWPFRTDQGRKGVTISLITPATCASDAPTPLEFPSLSPVSIAKAITQALYCS